MNYYPHHIGDYAAATAYLSLIEDAIYTRLLRVYYRDEKPLPLDIKAVAWLIGLRSRKEMALLENLLSQFFQLQDDGWHNSRADKEIERYRSSKETAQENGKKGGRPKTKGEPSDNLDETNREPEENPTETQTKPSANPTETQTKPKANPEQTQGKANQEPITNNQQPKTNNTHPPPSQIGTAPPCEAPSVCVDASQTFVADTEILAPDDKLSGSHKIGTLAGLLRRAGVLVSPGNPDFREWVTVNDLDTEEAMAGVEIVRVSKPRPEPIPWGYLSKVLRSQRNETPSAKRILAKPKSDADWAMDLAI